MGTINASRNSQGLLRDESPAPSGLGTVITSTPAPTVEYIPSASNRSSDHGEQEHLFEATAEEDEDDSSVVLPEFVAAVGAEGSQGSVSRPASVAGSSDHGGGGQMQPAASWFSVPQLSMPSFPSMPSIGIPLFSRPQPAGSPSFSRPAVEVEEIGDGSHGPSAGAYPGHAFAAQPAEFATPCQSSTSTSCARTHEG